MRRRHYAAFPISSVKADDDEAGTFEAIVSVFGNVDFAGDRIVEGAFANTIEQWKASGDPIPVIWSHQWHDPAAYIGTVDPDNISEIPAGSDELPESIREFSFAYDVLEEAKNEDDNINELLEIDLIEVGPTLKGANPLTELVGAKAFDAAFAKVLATLDIEPHAIDELLKDLEAEVGGIEPEPEADSKTLADLAGIIDRLDEALKTVGLEVFITKAGDREPVSIEEVLIKAEGSSSGGDEKYLDPATLATHIDADLIELVD